MSTCNLNGLQGNGHLVARRLKSPPSCLLLQETKLNNAKQLETFRRHLDNEVGAANYTLFVNDLRADNVDTIRHRQCGVASLFHSTSPGFGALRHLVHLDIPGRYLVAQTTWGGIPVYFHNVYAPVESQDRPEFFLGLPRAFESNSIHLIGGDFNLPIDSTLDTTSPHPRHSSGKVECVEWLAALRAIDPWRMFHPHERLYSGPGRVNRLDYLFVDHDLATNLCTSTSYGPNNFGGDHLLHSLTLSHSHTPPSRSYWRLPRELLADQHIQLGIQQDAALLLERMTSEPDSNHGAMWYGWLKRMKSRLIACHRQYLEANKTTLHHLQLKVAAAKRAFELTGVGAAEVGAAKLALDHASAEHRQHAMDRQFDFHANANERGTSHFFRRPQGTKVPIVHATVDGVKVTDTATVHNTFTSHWRRIMTTDTNQPPTDHARRRAVLASLSKRLDPADRDELDSPITAAELCAALKTMDPKKSPGPDGWPAGFFQVAPELFSHILRLVFEYQLTHHGELLPQQRRSAVALLFKAGDRGDPGNYRPIALMAVEVKILSRAMAFRLATYASKLIHPSQAGFVPGRRLHDHVAFVQSLQQYCTLEDHDHYATFLDFSKAYDMVDQEFLFGVLEEINVGPSFLRWVRLLYASPVAQLIFNGSLGPDILPTRGVKQGCPLSCLLFVLYIEPLGDLLRQQPHLGIPLPDGDTTTSIFFADDSTLLSRDLPSAVAQMAIVEEFCAVSGARLNQAKCMTLVLNGHLDPGDIDDGGLLNVLATQAPVKYLGIYLGHRLSHDHQIAMVNDRFLACFQQWGCRARTIQGRRLLVHTVMLSLLWHVTAVTPVPVAMVQSWQSMLNRYILGRKVLPADRYRPLLPQTWQYDHRLGLGLPHVASRLRAQRLLLLQRLVKGPTDHSVPWQPLVLRQFARTMGKLYRTSHPFDFLLYHPHHRSKWLMLWELHPLWMDVWSQWAATPITQRIQLPLTLAATLQLPVWLTTFAPTLSVDGKCAANLVNSPATRRWCLYGVSNGLHCLDTMLTVDRAWPSRSDLLTRMSNGNPHAPVELAPNGTMRWTTVHRAGMIYNHLSRIYDNLVHSFHGAPPAAPPPPVPLHPFRALVKDVVQPFELWPRSCVVALAYHAPAELVRHPMGTPARVDPAILRSYVKRARRTCRLPPPVQGDVWLRLLFYMLPVNSRFSYLQTTQPDAIYCTYGCGSVETQSHAFHACSAIHPIWAFHGAAWRCFGVTFSWASISDLDNFAVSARCAPHKDALHVLWTLLTAATLHLVWTQHNLVKYEAQNPIPPDAWRKLTFLGWMTSVRRWLRLQPLDCATRLTVIQSLHQLRRHPNYSALWAQYPHCLQLQPSPPTA